MGRYGPGNWGPSASSNHAEQLSIERPQPVWAGGGKRVVLASPLPGEPRDTDSWTPLEEIVVPAPRPPMPFSAVCVPIYT